MKEYTTALYIRLSQEDDNIGESNSIISQRNLLNDFIANHRELSNSKVLYFIDDGYSGTNFERPAVKDMLEQVRKGEIDCIVVKDFSRFGRNYVEVVGYIEQVFPFLGVRFLSVNDLFDSSNGIGGNKVIEVGFKTLLHDMYSKDISVKSTTGKMTKIKKGEHVNGTAPFGYVKSKTVKHAWEIDGEAAVTTRRIFELALQGVSPCNIAKQLNGDGVPAPLAYRINNNTDKGVHCRRVDEVPLWRMANVSRILRDERYTGKLITGKQKRIKVGGRKTTPVPKSEWIVIPNAHEPIVSDEVFNRVQELLGAYKQRTIKRVNSNIFAGKIFCGHCNHALRRYVGLNPKYICQSSRETQEEKCLSDVIYEASIKEVLLAAVSQELSLAASDKKQIDRQNKLLNSERDKLTERIKRLYADVQKLKHSRGLLFEDYAEGKITTEQYTLKKSGKSAEIEEKEAEILRLSNEIEKQSQSNVTDKKYEQLKPFSNCNDVTPEMMSLVNGIYVFDSTHIEIRFNFSDGRGQVQDI